MKHARKLFALLLCLMMVVSMAMTAFAADHKLTINTVNGHTYTIYQLLKGDVTNLKNGSGTLTNVTAGDNLKSSTTVVDFDAAIKDQDGNYLQNEELANAAYAYVNTDSTGKTVVGTGSPVDTVVADGYYLVVDSWTNNAVIEGDALSRYMVAVVGDTTMTPKVSKPEIDKKIIDTDANKALDDYGKTDTAAIGDTIEYQVTSKVPNTEGYTYYYYVVNDTLSKGLTLVGTSFEVKVGSNTLTKGTHYYVYTETNDDGITTFKLAFEDMKKLVDDKTVNVNDDISIKYNATVNKDAEIGTTANTNTVKLVYSNNPGESVRHDITDKPGIPGDSAVTGETPDYITKTYVTELTIDKIDQDSMPLTGAEFTLTGNNLKEVIIKVANKFETAAEGQAPTHYELKDGTFTTKAPSSAKQGEAGYNADQYVTPDEATHVRVVTVTDTTEATTVGETFKVTGIVDASGRITFTGLNAGDYTLTETKTPAGYNTIAPIEFTIGATQNGATETTGGNITWTSNNVAIQLDGTNSVFNTEIQNLPGSTLPETGGMGTTVLYILGGIMVLAAVVLLVTKKRMTSAE